MKLNFSFKQHIAQKFFVYLVPLVVIPVICTYSIHLKTRPKAIERFSIFSEVQYKDEGLLQEDVFKVVPEDLQIDLYSMERNDRLFNTYLSTYGHSSDICLLSKTTLSEYKSVDFIDLTGTKWDTPDNYHFNDYSIGIPYHKNGEATDNNYFDFETTTDDYYWVIMNTSVHLNGLKEESKTDQVVRILEHFYG